MKRIHWALLLMILLVGVALRVWDLAHIPPGLYHDEAYSGLDAVAILRGVGFPVFLEGGGGRAPVFAYLQALSIFLLGPSPFALRLPTALIGLATLAVFFVLVRAINFKYLQATAVALIATAGLATSYWHLNFSRVGWETNLLLLFACLAVYFFWRARRTFHWRDHILAGVWLGASLYTYLPARFLPMVIASFWLVDFTRRLLSDHRTFPARQYLRDAFIVVIVALIVFTPQAIYFIQNPPAFFLRVTDVRLAGANPLEAIASNAWRVAKIFFASGDLEWRHGLAGRLVLDWVIGIPFALGLLLTFWRWRRPESWFAWLWLVVMLLPTILSKDAPDLQRAIGALPAVYMLVAWGLDWLVQQAAARFPSTRQALVPAATLLLLAGSGAITCRDYFFTWANDPHAYYDYHGDLADIAAFLNSQSQSVVLPLDLYASSTIHFLTLARYDHTKSLIDLDEREKSAIAAEPKLLVLPPGLGGGQQVLLRGNAIVFLDPSEQVTPPQNLGKQLSDRQGRPLVTVAEFPKTMAIDRIAPLVPLRADFDHRLTLFGYALEPALAPGSSSRLTLYWSFVAPTQQSFSVFVHLLDAKAEVVAAGVTEPMAKEFHSSLLPVGQTIPDEHMLSIPADVGPGRYWLEIGIYLPASDARMPVWLNGERDPNDRELIPLMVAPSSSR